MAVLSAQFICSPICAHVMPRPRSSQPAVHVPGLSGRDALVDEIGGLHEAEHFVGFQVFTCRFPRRLHPKPRTTFHGVAVDQVVLALHRPVQDLAKQSKRLVDSLRPEGLLGRPNVEDLDVVLCGEFQLLGFSPSRPVAPANDGFVGYFRQPVALELGEDVATQHVAVPIERALIEIDAVPIEPDGGELMEERIVLLGSGISGIGGRQVPALDLAGDLLELSIRELLDSSPRARCRAGS